MAVHVLSVIDGMPVIVVLALALHSALKPEGQRGLSQRREVHQGRVPILPRAEYLLHQS